MANNDYDKSMYYYRTALDKIAIAGNQGKYTEKEVIGSRMTVFDGMANVSMEKNKLKEAENYFKTSW